jgi:SNF2 family DNA or RNA helicase
MNGCASTALNWLLKLETKMPIEDYKFKTKPYPHQLRALKDGADKSGWAFLFEPGLGKTKTTIDNAGYLYETGRIDIVVVVTLKAMTDVWLSVEFPEHLPERFKYKTFLHTANTAGTAAYRGALKDFKKPTSDLRIVAINIDGLANAKGEKLLNEVYALSKKGVMFVLDESTTVKNVKAKRTKAAVAFAKKAKYRRILTGTPITNSPIDLFGQLSCVGDPYRLVGHRTFYSFQNYFADMETVNLGGRSFKKVRGFRHLDELQQKLATFSTFVRKEEALDLPDKIYSRVPVPLTQKQAEIYAAMRDEAIAELSSGDTIEVTHVLTQLVKLQQIACGQLKLTDDIKGPESYESIPNNRLDALTEIIEAEGPDEKIIVWSTFRGTLYDVIKTLRTKYGHDSVLPYFGSVSDKSRLEAISRFNDPKDPARFFVANPASAGWGLTLTISNIAIYYSNNYSLEQRIQSEDRIHRISQTRSARYIDMYSPGTIDEKILKVLRDKKNLAESVTAANALDWLR